MEGAELELERRSKFLSSLIEKKKAKEHQEQHSKLNVRVRAADMSVLLQDRAFRCARDQLDSMPGKLDSKRLALALKKFLLVCQEFDAAYGPAWHCIVGTSFGSYVTHSTGGFLYFSIDKFYILLFRTAVEPLDR
ncbi:PREDICTED: dynein light chain, cytoplasmic-like isoform X2 [Populus euphratica]|uniref:Dynein light chain n=1 Tax=Populus euphratica TaxID=75702 RepID=A0AAJ6XKA7_POPEU|nr:PREDICTED: dynein light chain, cytoplasmic-like isoform X2 [Populus euphratica]